MSDPKYLVGLTGKAGHGKTTVANYLIEKHGFVRFSMAGPLKEMARRIDPFIGMSPDGPWPIRLNQAFAQFGGDEYLLKELYPEYRNFLQKLGTDGIRHVDDEFWVRIARESILNSHHKRIVVDDVRFPNEADLFDNLWCVERPGHDGGAGVHISESHVGKMGERDLLVNYGSLAVLYELIEGCLPDITPLISL